jgi:hypothetical protein
MVRRRVFTASTIVEYTHESSNAHGCQAGISRYARQKNKEEQLLDQQQKKRLI